jgi:hypothetical protein
MQLTDDQCRILTLRGQVTDLEGEIERARRELGLLRAAVESSRADERRWLALRAWLNATARRETEKRPARHVYEEVSSFVAGLTERDDALAAVEAVVETGLVVGRLWAKGDPLPVADAERLVAAVGKFDAASGDFAPEPT